MRNRQYSDILGGPVLVVADKDQFSPVIGWDAKGSFYDRNQFDVAPEGFTYLSVSPLPFTLYVKMSNNYADWSLGQQIKASPSDTTDAAESARNSAILAANSALVYSNNAQGFANQSQGNVTDSQNARDIALAAANTAKAYAGALVSISNNWSLEYPPQITDNWSIN